MSQITLRLSTNSLWVLEMMAAGHNYEQILSAFPHFTYLDIFHAAEEALLLGAGISPTDSIRMKTYTLQEKRKRYPRAYLPWSEDEDHTLGNLTCSGMTVARIAMQLQRNRGAIRSRIVKLNLVGQLTRKEQDRLRRITGLVEDEIS